MRARTVSISLFLAFAAMVAQATTLPPAQGNLGVAPVVNGSQQVVLGNSALALMGPWKFRAGNDLKWTLPSYDDSGWEDYTLSSQGWAESMLGPTAASDPGWAGHGHLGLWGYGWYRIHVDLQQSSGPISLFFPIVNSAYTVYWDGQKLGNFGDPERHTGYVFTSKQFAVPATLSLPGKHLLAIQVWNQPSQALQSSTHDGGLRGAPLLVTGPLAFKLQQLAERSRLLWLIADTTPDLAAGGVGILALILFFLNRRRLEYLWIALTLLCFVVPDATLCVAMLTDHLTYRTYAIAYDVFNNQLMPLFGLLAAIWLMHLQRARWLLTWVLATWIPYFLFSAAVELDDRLALFSGRLLHWSQPVFILAFADSILIMLYVSVAGIRARGREAWIDLSPGITLFGFFLLTFVLQILHVASSTLAITLYIFFVVLIPLPVVAIILRRYLRQWREHQHLESELQQAQTVQALLVPERLPQMPGYLVEGTYLPASQVGGDFYQVLPLPDQSLILVLGDVSGKGLRAAMVVSMAVGAVRAIAKEVSRPEEILQRLNRELTGNLKSAFVTCVCVHVHADGTVTLANAGHLSPWVNGAEVATEGALPLGMLAMAEYDAKQFHLNHGDTLTVMSDGIVEARREQNGELYGFDRLASLMAEKPSSEKIALAAQRFGQEDDISVLQITRLPRAQPDGLR